MRYQKSLLLASVVIAGAAVVAHRPAIAQTSGSTEPGGDPASAQLAQSDPDEYAWRLFEFVNLQAAPGLAGAPTPNRSVTSYDPDMPTVWETWALASGDGATQDGSEVYKADGSRPVDWSALPRSGAMPKHFSVNFTLNASLNDKIGVLPKFPMTGKSTVGKNKIFIGPGNPLNDFEVRMNQAAYKFVADNELYNTQGLAAKLVQARASGNRDLITFPDAAKEIKAVWLPTANPNQISVDEKARYHWRKSGGTYYKLGGFHIITRDLKLWFWADFAQEDFETTDLDGKATSALGSRDSTTRGPLANARGSKEGERKELTSSKWAHYRLRGTQIGYLDPAGKPVIVGNTLIENGFADKSSCMSCHFRATVGSPAGNGGNTALRPGLTDVGIPVANQLGKDPTIAFLQTDFIWSAPFRAQPKAK